MAESSRLDLLLPRIEGREDATAVFSRDGAPFWSREELRQRLRTWRDHLSQTAPDLVFLLATNSPEAVAALYGALAAGHRWPCWTHKSPRRFWRV